jgi:hypothetical protein
MHLILLVVCLRGAAQLNGIRLKEIVEYNKFHCVIFGSGVQQIV